MPAEAHWSIGATRHAAPTQQLTWHSRYRQSRQSIRYRFPEDREALWPITSTREAERNLRASLRTHQEADLRAILGPDAERVGIRATADTARQAT